MGTGNNIGISKSNTRYIMILNPDTILRVDTLDKIFGISKNLDFAILSPLSDNKDFPNYKAVIGTLEINNNSSDEKNILKPEIRIYDNPKTLTYEASIKTNLLKDYYLTMSNIDRSDYYNIKFQKKPLMIWIWISVIMIVVGGFLRLFKNAKYS